MDFASNLTNLFRQAKFRTSVKDFLEDFRSQVRAEAENSDDPSGHDYRDGDEFQCWIDGEVGDIGETDGVICEISKAPLQTYKRQSNSYCTVFIKQGQRNASIVQY